MHANGDVRPISPAGFHPAPVDALSGGYRVRDRLARSRVEPPAAEGLGGTAQSPQT